MNRRQDRRGAARGRSAGRLLRYLESVRHATDEGLATALRDPIERAGALEALREQGLLETDPLFGLAPVPGQARRYFPYCKECRSRPHKMSCTRAYARRLHGDPDAHTVVNGALCCRPCEEEREAQKRARAWSLSHGVSEAELPALPARVVIDRDPCPHQGPWVKGSPVLASAALDGDRSEPETDGVAAVATGEGTMAQTKKPEAQSSRQQRHDEIATYVAATKDTPGIALDPALEEAGTEAWLAADPERT